MLAVLAKPVVILKLGMWSISKRITSLIFLNIYTPLQHTLTHALTLFLKAINKANSKFDLKIKEALHINWTKPNLNRQQNHLILTLFTIASVPLAPFCLCLFFFCYFLHFSFIYCSHYLYANYRHLLLS